MVKKYIIPLLHLTGIFTVKGHILPSMSKANIQASIQNNDDEKVPFNVLILRFAVGQAEVNLVQIN